MTAVEMKETCLKGSKAYYDYLAAQPNGGVEEVIVRRIERINENTYKLKINRKLFDPDTICFLYNGNAKETYDSEKMVIKVYDNNKRIIVVKVADEVIPFISELNPNHWKVIIDLKFLVTRVIEWYKLNGNDLKFFSGKNESKIQFDNAVILPGIIPSDEQNQALEMVFSKKFSYIWGAPGTGKTRFVLSYAILNYIKNEQKVLVLAPTNTALEQVLEGIIEITDKASIHRKKIVRLGYPSEKFANELGEVCEIQGLEKELKRISIQIRIIQSILGIKNEVEKEYRNNLRLINNTLALKQQKSSKELMLADVIVNKKKYKKLLKKGKEQIQKLDYEIKELIEIKKSLIANVFQKSSLKVNYDQDIEALSCKVLSQKGEIEKYTLATKEYKKQEKTLKKDVLLIDEEINKIVEKLKSIEIFDGKCDDEDLENLKKLLQENWEKEIENEQIYTSLAEEYEGLSRIELHNVLRQYNSEREELRNHSLDARIENANVIGATIDTYLHRYLEKRLSVAHVFIDEAGYASAVKALTVFTDDTPITLLGDHKQLAPVSELSKRDIQRNVKYNDVFLWDQSAIFLGDVWNSTDKTEALNNYLLATSPSYENMPKSSLTQSYRFGPNLAEVLERYVYSEDGFTSNRVDNTEVIFVNVVNPLTMRRGSRLNLAEVQCVKEIVSQGDFPSTDSFVILAPYRDQIRALKRTLPDLRDENKILTVHKSQGKEWDTVIYSVCDIGNGKKPWFTDSTNTSSNGLNNINTAVSRAKKKLIILCSQNDWLGQSRQLISGLIQASTSMVQYNTSTRNFTNVTNRLV